VRIALHSISDVGRRAGRILLAERELSALGLYGHDGSRVADRRTIVIRELTGFDLLVTDDVAGASAFAGIAADDGIPCVVSADEVDASLADRFAEAGLTLLVGSGTVEAIATCLASHEIARCDEVSSVTLAWTSPGKPLHRGVAAAFPDPVGARWGRRVGSSPDRIEVPVSGPWAGATATVDGRVGGEVVHRVVGVADDREHLAGIALAAGALAVLAGGFGAGVHRPADAPEAYLGAALQVGLGVAAFSA
jgi:hypothetical protein